MRAKPRSLRGSALTLLFMLLAVAAIAGTVAFARVAEEHVSRPQLEARDQLLWAARSAARSGRGFSVGSGEDRVVVTTTRRGALLISEARRGSARARIELRRGPAGEVLSWTERFEP